MPEDAWTLDGQWTSSSILEMQSSRARRVAGKRGERRSDDMAEAERREEDGPRDYMREMTVDRAVENAALLGAQSKKETKKKEALESFWSFFVSRHPRNLESGRSERLV